MNAERTAHVSVEIDEDSGFCFGVERAIEKAETEMERDGHLYCLGDIVHNSMEQERLQQKGLEVITHERMRTLGGVRVLLRAHGEPPETYRMAAERNIEVVDASCPVVRGLQRKIRKAYEAADGQVVIFGKKSHAEVIGLVGQTEGHAIVVEHAEDIAQIDPGRNVRLFAQTTMSRADFEAMGEKIKAYVHDGIAVERNDTTCKQVAGRAERLRKFAAAHDVVVFVSGRQSSNGKVLYGVCKTENPLSYRVEGPEEISREMVWGMAKEAETIGVCGATSTPKWLMRAVAERIEMWMADGTKA